MLCLYPQADLVQLADGLGHLGLNDGHGLLVGFVDRVLLGDGHAADFAEGPCGNSKLMGVSREPGTLGSTGKRWVRAAAICASALSSSSRAPITCRFAWVASAMACSGVSACPAAAASSWDRTSGDGNSGEQEGRRPDKWSPPGSTI